MESQCEVCAKRKRDAAERAEKRKQSADTAKRNPKHQAGLKATKLARELPKKLADMKRLHGDFAEDGAIQKVVIDAMTAVHADSGTLLKGHALEAAAADLEAFSDAVQRGEADVADEERACIDRIDACMTSLK